MPNLTSKTKLGNNKVIPDQRTNLEEERFSIKDSSILKEEEDDQMVFEFTKGKAKQRRDRLAEALQSIDGTETIHSQVKTSKRTIV